MKPLSKTLMASAKEVLEDRGYALMMLTGPGIVQGSRFRATKDDYEMTMSIRTSKNREISLSRNQTGRWRLSSTIDEVIFAVPAPNSSRMVDVFCFSRHALVKFFDEVVKEGKKEGPSAWKTPVFVSLDGSEVGGETKALKEVASWRQNALQASCWSVGKESDAEFRNRICHEYAELKGIKPEALEVQFVLKPSAH